MAKKGKLPKRIAGVKIPKKLRKRGAPIYALLDNPMVRNVVADILAVGLLAAADSISKQPKVKKAGKAAKHAAKDAAEDTADAAESNVVDFASILALAAREGARALKSKR
jgi:hypothetical protein